MTKQDPSALALEVIKSVATKYRDLGYSSRIEYIEDTNAIGVLAAAGESVIENIAVPAATLASVVGTVLALVVVKVMDITGAGVVIAGPAAGGVQFVNGYLGQQLPANIRCHKWVTAKEVADREVCLDRPMKIEQGQAGIVTYGTTVIGGMAAWTAGLGTLRLIKDA